jgi:hypothetical protein
MALTHPSSTTLEGAVPNLRTQVENGGLDVTTLQKDCSRPECFNSTLQECLFVLTATMSIGMSSFLYGICTVITAPIGRDLNMTSAEITWINASSAFVSPHILWLIHH